MKHYKFGSFKDFFEYFELPKSCSIRISSEENAYFTFHPYEKDAVIIRGWIIEFNHKEVQVLFKYKEFDLGITTWSFEEANKYIKYVNYYSYED